MIRLQQAIENVFSAWRSIGTAKYCRSRAQAPQRRGSRFLPLEPLERRDLLSVTVGFDGVDGNLLHDTAAIYLNANQPNQQINIVAEGGDLVSGMDLYVTLGNNPNATTGPKISSLDALTGTIFATNHIGGDDPDVADTQYAYEYRNLVTASGRVAASGLLGTLTLDTTGLSSANGWTTSTPVRLHLEGIVGTIYEGIDSASHRPLPCCRTWTSTSTTSRRLVPAVESSAVSRKA